MEPSWGHLGASWGDLGPSWGYLGPSWGHLGRILGILSHLRAILAPSCAKGCPRRLGSMSPGIFDPILGTILGPKTAIFLVILGGIFWTSFLTLFGQLWGPFWGPFWDQIGPRRGQDGPKRATKSFKDLKFCFCKNLKTRSVFQGFWGPEASQQRLQSSMKAPKRHTKSSKTSNTRDQKIDPKIIDFWTDFGLIFG